MAMRPTFTKKRQPTLMERTLDEAMKVHEWFALIEWEQRFTQLSYLIAVLLNALYLFVKLYGNDALEIGVIAICGLNTMYMFMRFRTYLLFQQPTTPNHHNPSDRSWFIKSPHAQIVSVDITGAVREDEESAAKRRMNVKKWFSHWRGNITATYNQRSAPITKRVWQLKTWNPSPGSMNLFCWFSPMQVAIMNHIDTSNWGYYLPLSCICSSIVYFLMTSFQELVRDREILSGQVLQEFSENMYKLDAFPPPRSFDIVTRGLSTPALVSANLMREEEGPWDEWPEEPTVSPLAQWVKKNNDPSQWIDPNVPDEKENVAPSPA
ncbi:hypothetical protein DFJ77DRAFT_457901 [Powellomyces hirtus]|nr:hypothetical protein DFJ77DRAFT_457901 [Powellomyces hirtus]